MTGQPDFFVPVRDPALPAGDSVGQDTESGFRIGWSYEPDTDPTPSVFLSLSTPLTNFGRGITIGTNGNYYVMSSTELIEVTPQGAERPFVRAGTAIASGSFTDVAADASGLIIHVASSFSQGSLYRIPYTFDSASIVSTENVIPTEGIALVDNEVWFATSTGNIARRSLQGSFLGLLVLRPAVRSTSYRFGLSVGPDKIYVTATTSATSNTPTIAVYDRNTLLRLTDETITMPTDFQGIEYRPDGLYCISGRADIYRVAFVGIPLQDFSLRRSTSGGSSWQYYNGSAWQNTEDPQPASLLQDEGIIEVPATRRFRLTLGDNWGSGTQQHQFQVRNRDELNAWSPWSDSIRVQPGTPLGVNIITPDQDDGDLSAEFNPQWTVSGGSQGYYRVTTRSLGRLLQRTVVFVTSRASHIWGTSGTDQLLTSLPNEPDEGSTLDIEVEVWSAQLVRTVGRRRATLRYTAPIHAFNLAALEESDHAAVLVTWTAPALRGANPPSSRVELWRRVEGENPLRIHNDTEPLTNNADTDAAFTDYWAPLERLLEYRVLTYGARNQTDDTAPWFE